MNFFPTGVRQSLRISRRRRRVPAILMGSLLGSCAGMAAVVSMHPPSGGGELRIPVLLYGDGDEYVSGLQFDLNYDPTQFELVSVSAGTVATDAGKEVIFSETTPGQGRILVTGFNNLGMADGQVATITLRPLTDSSPQHDISLEDPLASDPDGNSIPLGYADLYQYPPAPPVESDVNVDPEAESTDESTTTPEATDDPPTNATVENNEDENLPEALHGNNGVATGAFGGSFGAPRAGNLPETEGSTKKGTGESALQSSPRRMHNSGKGIYSSRTQGSPRGNRDRRTGMASQSDSPRRIGAGTSTGRVGQGVESDVPTGGPHPVGVSSDAVPPTPRLARVQAPSGLNIPVDDNTSAYTLAFNAATPVPAIERTRVVVAVLMTALLGAALALYHVLFGRRARHAWRQIR